MKEKGTVVKWGICLIVGFIIDVLAVAVVRPDNFGNYGMFEWICAGLFIAFTILFYCLISKPIKFKIQSGAYGIIASILCSAVLSAALSLLTAYGWSISPFLAIVQGIIYGTLIYAIAAKFDKK